MHPNRLSGRVILETKQTESPHGPADIHDTRMIRMASIGDESFKFQTDEQMHICTTKTKIRRTQKLHGGLLNIHHHQKSVGIYSNPHSFMEHFQQKLIMKYICGSTTFLCFTRNRCKPMKYEHRWPSMGSTLMNQIPTTIQLDARHHPQVYMGQMHSSLYKEMYAPTLTIDRNLSYQMDYNGSDSNQFSMVVAAIW